MPTIEEFVWAVGVAVLATLASYPIALGVRMLVLAIQGG